MAQKSRPDPASGNVVSADEYEALSISYAADGVYGTPADSTVVYADSTGRQVKVRAGKRAIVRGYEWFSDPTTDEIINNGGAGLPANTSGQPRIDRLVLRLDRTARTVRTQYLQGTPGAVPVAPALTQNLSTASSVFDFPLARWQIASGYTTVAAGDVINEAWYQQGSGPVLCNSTSRPFGVYLYKGLTVYEYDTGQHTYWDGSTWSPRAGRMVAYGQRPSGSNNTTVLEAPILRIDNIPVIAGHRYWTAFGFNFYDATTGDFMRGVLRYNMGGPATGASTQFGVMPQLGTNSFTAQGLHVSGSFVAPSTGLASVLFSLNRFSGSGTYRLEGSVEVPIFDGGPDPVLPSGSVVNL